jgi:hypothetical protein
MEMLIISSIKRAIARHQDNTRELDRLIEEEIIKRGIPKRIDPEPDGMGLMVAIIGVIIFGLIFAYVLLAPFLR